MKKKVFFLMFFVFLFLFAAYDRSSPKVKGIFTIFASPTPTATLTPAPTSTPMPTLTSTPTLTPTPTFTPTSTPTPTLLPTSAFEDYFNQYSSEYNVDKNLLKKIAYCESGMAPGAAYGVYGGLYQFTEDTWKKTRMEMGTDPNPDLRFGAKESIETAAYKLAHQGENAWRNCL